MINLLPPDVKESYMYARRNTLLLHWSAALCISLALIIVVIVSGHFYIAKAVGDNTRQLEDARAQLKLQKVEDTQKRVEQLSSSLKLVTQVLSKEVLFSKLIQQIGFAMPEDTVLTDLSINKLSGGIDLKAASLDYQSGSQVQVNLSDPNNKIFSSADIVSIVCGSGGDGVSQYPCTVTVRAKFATNNPFLFINSGSGT